MFSTNALSGDQSFSKAQNGVLSLTFIFLVSRLIILAISLIGYHQFQLELEPEKTWGAKIEETWAKFDVPVSWASYRVCFLFPLIVLVRLIKKFTFLFKLHPKSDIKTPSKHLNSFFLAIQRLEHLLLKSGFRLPFGSSIFLVAKKSNKTL